MDKYDIAIIGSGPGGYVAAIRAAQFKKKVVLIEKDELGGVCLNWGCIPTKALLNVAKHYSFLKNKSNDLGIKIDNLSYDLNKVIDYSRKTADKLSYGITILMKKYKNNITVINGKGIIKKDKTIDITLNKNTTTIHAENIVIATGSSSIDLQEFDCSDKKIWNYRDALVPKKLPKEMAIIGSGAIGIEFANFYNAMGTTVHVIEMQNTILPLEDHEISKIAKDSFVEQGINIYIDSKSKIIKNNKDSINIEISNKKQNINIDVECVLVAVGVKGNTNNIGIENFANIKIEGSFIKIDNNYNTGEKNIFAIGDVTGPPCLAHRAMHDAVECIEKICGLTTYLPNKSMVPSCTYSFPQIASIGITEQKAKEKKMDVKIGKFNAIGNGKSVVIGETKGIVKVILDKKTDELLGAHMLGPDVTEMIQGFSIIQYLEGTSNWVKKIIFAHPTISEMMHEAILDSNNEALHS